MVFQVLYVLGPALHLIKTNSGSLLASISARNTMFV